MKKKIFARTELEWCLPCYVCVVADIVAGHGTAGCWSDPWLRRLWLVTSDVTLPLCWDGLSQPATPGTTTSGGGDPARQPGLPWTPPLQHHHNITTTLTQQLHNITTKTLQCLQHTTKTSPASLQHHNHVTTTAQHHQKTTTRPPSNHHNSTTTSPTWPTSWHYTT